MNVEKHGTRRVAGVGYVGASSIQLPDEPAVHVAEGELSAVGEATGTRHVVEDPGNFAGGKVRIDQQAGALLDQRFVAVGFELVAERRGATVLPDNRVVNRLSGFAVPYDGGLSLIGNPECGNVPRTQFGSAQSFHRNADL